MRGASGRTLRVLVLTADYPPHPWSGIGVAVELQARSLAALGVDVQVLVAAHPDRPAPLQAAHPNGPAPLQAAHPNGPAPVPAAHPNGPAPVPAAHPNWPAPVPAAGGRLSVLPLSSRRFPVDPRAFDVVHLHSLALAGLAVELRRRTGVPLVYTAHTLLRDELRHEAGEAGPEPGTWQTVQERLLDLCDHVVFLSAAERTAALALAPALAGRSTLVPHGVPPPEAVDRPGGVPPSEQDGPVVFAGRFARSKGLELLAETVPVVLARRPARFVLAGGHGDALGDRVVRDLRMRHPEACSVTGWLTRDQVDALFARAAMVLVPSLYEPFGLVALEAMRVGAPVLAADVGGLHDILAGDSGGRLVDSRDPGRWADEICAILASGETRRRLGWRGPHHVRTRFDASRAAARLVDEVYSAAVSLAGAS